MSKGRSVPPLPEVTLPDSGYIVAVRAIGPLTIDQVTMAVRREIPKPQPPLVEVSILGNTPKQQPNEADPAYIEAVEQWELEVYKEAGERILDLIAVRAIATPVDAEAVAQARADLHAVGVECPEDDRIVFLRHVLIGSRRDMNTLQDAVTRRSMPVPEVIDEYKESFRRNVQGEAAHSVSDAPVGGEL